MAIIPITKDHIDTVTLEMHPERMFSSSSVNGITGSVYVYANRSPFNRQRIESAPFSSYASDPETLENVAAAYSASSYETEFLELVESNPTWDSSVEENRSFAYDQYLSRVNTQLQSPELNKFMEIWRFKPSFSFTSNTLRKNVVKDILFKYYSGIYGELNWAYSNYHCLTFFTASEISPTSVLLYPPQNSPTANAWNQYISTSSFSVSFWVNPRRTTTTDSVEYKAGTILHSSSSFAFSIVSGSEKDDFGNPEAFRLLLQLSHSADVAPSNVNLNIANNARSAPEELIFVTPDNSLKKNQWHHVTFSWDKNHNFGSGSIWIDCNESRETQFFVSGGNLNDAHVTGRNFIPLAVGNYYNAPNVYDTVAGYSDMAKYFNQGAASLEGIPVAPGTPSAGIQMPSASFDHKPNVDLHDLRIYNKFLTKEERETAMARGPLDMSGLLFYLPPFYTKESPYRQSLTTPYFTTMTASAEPFNVNLSFGVGGHDLNIENFTRDFATGNYPRHLCLTSSVVTADTLYATANQILWDRGDYIDYFRNRQLFLLPCDNGLFYPNFNLLASGTVPSDNKPLPRSGIPVDQFIDDNGYLDYSLVSLRNLVATSSIDALKIYTDPNAEESDLAKALAGGSAYDPDFMTSGDETPPDPFQLTVIQRTQDNSSNELYFFDASNLFYGNRIMPGTFVIEDVALTGSSGAVGMKIRDDGRGNLYRADCNSKQAEWNSVGNVLYDEGIAVIKSPNIPLFGQDQFEINFTGLHNVHTYEVNVLLSPNLFTSSSNPTFKGGRPNDYANTADPNFVAFNSILLHDDNLNVITRSNLARPVVKQIGDKYLVRIKIDY